MTIVVLDEEGDGEWEIIPAPSLFADPSIPRHSRRPAAHQLTISHVFSGLLAGGKGDVFFLFVEVTMIMTIDDKTNSGSLTLTIPALLHSSVYIHTSLNSLGLGYK